jgi:hypothetical protein
LGRATALPGTSFLSQKKKGLSKMITRVFHRTVLLRSCGQSCYANSPPPPSWGKRNEPVSAVFLQDRSFRESLASTFFFLLMKLIMNTARGHLTPEIHVKIKYFRNTYI